jgi:hypothetical protein
VNAPPVKKTASSKSSSKASKRDAFSSDDDEEEEDELWCTRCLDDDRITTCAFCGCKVKTINLYFQSY